MFCRVVLRKKWPGFCWVRLVNTLALLPEPLDGLNGFAPRRLALGQDPWTWRRPARVHGGPSCVHRLSSSSCDEVPCCHSALSRALGASGSLAGGGRPRLPAPCARGLRLGKAPDRGLGSQTLTSFGCPRCWPVTCRDRNRKQSVALPAVSPGALGELLCVSVLAL